MRSLLDRSNVRLVTLIGPGGVGKTRLALAVATAAERDYVAGAVLVALSAVPDAALVPSAIAQALGIRDIGDRPLVETLIQTLQHQHMLLLLDNLEHVLAAAPVIAELLVSCPELQILATSRAVLRVSGEHDLPVPPLEVPNPADGNLPESLAASPAVRLFVTRAQAAVPDFSLTPANGGAVAAICRRLEGLPLAIELAAAQVRHLPVAGLLDHLDTLLPMLTGGSRDHPPRLRTMRDAIAWSYDLLSPEEQTFFRRVAVLAGGGDLDAVGAVTTGTDSNKLDVLSGVRSLVEKSLLTLQDRSPQEPRYGMLETIREFGLEQLAASGEEPEIRSAHAAYFLTLAREAETHLIASGSAQWVERLAVERANLHAAVTWSLAQGDAEAVLRLAGTILSLAYARGEARESQQWLEAALASGREAAPEARVDALFTASALAQVRGDFARSIALSTDGLAVARDCGYEFGEARALLQLGITAEWQGDLDLAAQHYEASRRLMSHLRDPPQLAHWTLLPVANLADIAFLQGDAPRAMKLADEAISGWRAAGYVWGLAQALGTAAAAASALGDQSHARRLFDETLTLWLDSDDGRGIAGTLAGIAGLAYQTGQYTRAARLLGAAWSLADALGVRYLAHHVHAERIVAATRSRLDDDAFAAAWRDGGNLSLEQAVSEARLLLSEPDSKSSIDRASAQREITTREYEVLRLLVAGHPDREIAAILQLSPRTVQSHVANLFAKFGVNSRVELTATAVRQRLV